MAISAMTRQVARNAKPVRLGDQESDVDPIDRSEARAGFPATGARAGDPGQRARESAPARRATVTRTAGERMPPTPGGPDRDHAVPAGAASLHACCWEQQRAAVPACQHAGLLAALPSKGEFPLSGASGAGRRNWPATKGLGATDPARAVQISGTGSGSRPTRKCRTPNDAVPRVRLGYADTSRCARVVGP